MPRFATAALALLLLAALSACKVDKLSTPATPTSGQPGSSTPPTATAGVIRTPGPLPTAVPETARAIEQTEQLGGITPQASQTPETVDLRKLLDAFCQDGLMIIQTSREAIYAGLPCDRFWDENARDHFLNHDVAITLEVTADRYRVMLRTTDGAQAEFTVEGVWVN